MCEKLVGWKSLLIGRLAWVIDSDGYFIIALLCAFFSAIIRFWSSTRVVTSSGSVVLLGIVGSNLRRRTFSAIVELLIITPAWGAPKIQSNYTDKNSSKFPPSTAGLSWGRPSLEKEL